MSHSQCCLELFSCFICGKLKKFYERKLATKTLNLLLMDPCHRDQSNVIDGQTTYEVDFSGLMPAGAKRDDDDNGDDDYYLQCPQLVQQC